MTGLFSLIKFYFDLGLRHWETVLSLSHIDGITISLSTLRLFRRKAHSDLLDIAMFLQDQLDIYGILGKKSSIHVGYIQNLTKVKGQDYQQYIFKVLKV